MRQKKRLSGVSSVFNFSLAKWIYLNSFPTRGFETILTLFTVLPWRVLFFPYGFIIIIIIVDQWSILAQWGMTVQPRQILGILSALQTRGTLAKHLFGLAFTEISFFISTKRSSELLTPKDQNLLNHTA